jgi:oxygen-independent coproporphyrinogen-3 oxidase
MMCSFADPMPPAPSSAHVEFQTAPDRVALEALLPRYDTAGPRYTSYPTAPSWREEPDADTYRAILASLPSSSTAPHAIYLHIPFCRSLCHFCACNRVVTRKRELPARYLERLAREIKEIRQVLPGRVRAGQIHLGGGTPTHLTPAQLDELMEEVTCAFPVVDGAEISIELDPRVTSDAHLDVLFAWRFNRLSLGIQDFDPKVQAAIHREQSVAQVARLMERARAGADCGINFDLIYGLPHQNEESFDRTLGRVISLRPDRIALYGYAHVTWVARQQRGFERLDLPSAKARLALQLLAIERLTESGYVAIGMDHFALPTDELSRAAEASCLHRNFMGYTTRPSGELLAFGPSGISELSCGFVQSQRELRAWEAGIESAGLAPFRAHRSSDDDKRRAWVISQIMCQGAVSAATYRSLYRESFRDRFASAMPELGRLEEDGLLVLEADGSFRINATGRIFLRNAAMIFDTYLPSQKDRDGGLFSRTV